VGDYLGEEFGWEGGEVGWWRVSLVVCVEVRGGWGDTAL